MEQPNNLLWKNTMTSGAFLGLALVIFSIALVFIDFSKLGIYTIVFLSVIPIIMMIIGIIWGTKHYRNTVLDGYITYGNALFVGTMIVFFASIICAFYTYLFNGFIDPSYAERTAKAVLDKFIQSMQDHGFTDEQIEHQTSMMNTSSPLSALDTALLLIPQYAILGFLFSLVTSAFIKKEKSIFDKGMSNTQQ
jgi:hypothetical protein